MDGIDIAELLKLGLTALAGITGLLEIAPIKVNPWKWLAKSVGKALNAELCSELESLQQEVHTIKTGVQHCNDQIAKNEAVACRNHILRFGDECIHGVHHTKEHFDQILRDITKYEQYCTQHPEFPNNSTVETTKHIKKQYQLRLERQDFL